MLAGSLVVSLCLVGAHDSATAATSNAPIVVGGEGELTLTTGVSQGFQAGILRFNRAGGLDGRRIKYEGFLDDGFSPALTLTNIQQLVLKDHVFAVIPFNNDVATQAISSFLTQNHTPLIGWGISAPFINNPWAWSINSDYAAGTQSATTAFVQLREALHVKASQMKFAIISNDVAAGANANNVAAKAITAIGAKVVYDEANIPSTGTTNYAPFAEEIIGSGANVVFEGLGGPDLIGLDSALKSAGYTGSTLNGVAYFPGQLASQPSEEAALQGAYVSDEYPDSENKTLAVQQAIKDLRAVGAPPYLTTGVSVGYWSAQLFIAMLKATVAKVGSASKVTPQAMYRVVNAGFVYRGDLAGGNASETFPQAERIPSTCYGLLQIKGSTYVQKEPYACVGKLVAVK